MILPTRRARSSTRPRRPSARILLPVDAVVAKEFNAHAPAHMVDVDHVPEDEMILDIGPKSIAALEDALTEIKTLVWNGPLGAFETPPFDAAPMVLAKTAARLTKEGKLISVAGGGDTVAALNHARSPTISPSSRLRAARFWNGWKARRFRASRRSRAK